MLEELEEFRKAELDEPVQALTHNRLLVDQGHREPSSLAQLDAGKRIVSRQRFAHGQLGE
jgi:hypothetical protein